MAAGEVAAAGSAEQFQQLLQQKDGSLVVVHFWAPWAPQCAQMNEVMAALAKEHTQVTFVKLEAEAVPEVSEKYGISSVPTFLFFKNSQKVDRLDGAHAPELTKKVQRYVSSSSISAGSNDSAKEDLNVRLKKLINAAPCMLFMKGSPKEPRCEMKCCNFYCHCSAGDDQDWITLLRNICPMGQIMSTTLRDYRDEGIVKR